MTKSSDRSKGNKQVKIFWGNFGVGWCGRVGGRCGGVRGCGGGPAATKAGFGLGVLWEVLAEIGLMVEG